MGCNAWNHRSNCNCGWGGDTGGGGYQRNGYQAHAVADGLTWRLDHRPTYDSFINPNALCPVCGEPVFFYQSPFGGRVFFDQLGPPWPKHPCTDNGPSFIGGMATFNSVLAAPTSLPVATPPLHGRYVWRPLLLEDFVNIGKYNRICIPPQELGPGQFLYLPEGWAGHAPVFWRWCQSTPGMIEVTSINVLADNSMEFPTTIVPGWLKNDAEFDAWQMNRDLVLSPETLIAIGIALSFVWCIPGIERWQNLPGVDFERARLCFERAAESGHWAALNYLGVMYREGIGVERNPAKAFELFSRAAQSLESAPLRNLANCYRDGVGCDPDPDEQNYLEELLTTIEQKPNNTAA